MKVFFRIDRKDLYLFFLMLFFIFIVYVYANFVVIKNLDEYIDLKNKYDFQVKIQKDILENTQNAKMKFMGYRTYTPFLERMERHYDQKALGEVLEKFFDNIMVQLVEHRIKKYTAEYRYIVYVQMEDTKNFFDFLASIKKEHYPFVVSLPLEMKKVPGGIEATFKLDAYSLR